MVAQELNERRLTLVEGSALSERDLVRTCAQSAAAILLLADRFSPSAHQEDLGLQFQVEVFALPPNGYAWQDCGDVQARPLGWPA